MRRVVAWGLLPMMSGCSIFLSLDGLSDGPPQPNDQVSDADTPAYEASSTTDASADAGVDANRTSYAAAIVADEPLLYVRLGETSGSVAHGAIGVSGTYSTGGIALGVPGALTKDPDLACAFTDGSGSVTIPIVGDFDGEVPFSVEIWVKPDTTNSGLGFLLDHTDYEVTRRGWLLRVGTESIGFERWSTNAMRDLAVASPISADQWHHVVGTFDGAIQRVYVDAVRVVSMSATISLPARSSTLTVGHQSCDCSGASSFRGAIDELALYSKELTEARIAAHYAAATAR